MVTNISTTNTVNTNVGAHETMAHAGQTGGGNWLQQAGSWLGSDSMSQGMGGMGGMSNGEMILAADQTGGQIFGMLAGQNETKVGNIVKNIPGLSTVGNFINAAFGSHINDAFVNQTNANVNALQSRTFGSNTNADVLNDWRNMVQMSHVSKSEVGSDGWFNDDATDKKNELNDNIDRANDIAMLNFGHAVKNADRNTDLRIAQGMIAAYGGPINSFRKYYNDGGNLFNTPQFFTFEPQVHDDGGYLSKAKALIRQNEGWRAKPYKDAPQGKAWRSVGYGFNDSGFREKYPEGISKHYEHGITKEQAEQELDYFVRRAERTLKGIYGKQWDSFTDNQKAAIMDTYYQRPASVGKKSRFYKAVTAGEDAGKYLGVAGFSKRNNIRQGVFGGGAVPKSSGASYSSGYSNVDMTSSSGASQIDTEELSYPSPILEGRSPIVDFDLSGIEPTKVIDPKINLSRPAMDLNFMSSPIAQAPQPQAPTVGTVEDFLASYGDVDAPTIDASENNLFDNGGWLDFFKSWNQSQGGNNYFNMDNSWKPSDGLQKNTSNGSVQDWIGVAQTVGNTIANWGEEDPSLGRGGGYSMFGMAAYDLLKGIRDATKSKRESIDQKLGIPIYACGGRLYPDGGALGGMGAEGGGSVGAMGYAQVGTAALKLASNAVHQAKLTVDEDKIDRSINRYGFGFDDYARNVNTNGDLLDLWQNNATVNPNLSARDFRDKSEFDDFLNSYAASWEGFNAGQNFGNVGAIVGAVVGGLSSRIGSQIGKNKAKHAAEEANEEIERANERRQATLEYLAERVDHENDLRILQNMDNKFNSGASGGDLNMGFGLRSPFIMPDGVANPLYKSFGGGLTHGVNWDTGVNWVDEGGSHGENPLGGVPMGVDDQGIPNLVEEGEAIWNGDYVFSKRMKVPKKLAKKYGLGSDITFADAIRKLTKDSEERPLSMIDRDTNDHILGEFADVQEERRMAKAQRAMEREQQLQEDFMTGFQYGLGGHLSPFGIVPNSDNISPFEKAEQKFANGGGIHIDPSKRGTFKAQASRMGMGVQEAASHILANKENYSPAMVKKAVFAHNFAKAYGGDLFTNPFAYGGEMGNTFDGTGDRPNTLSTLDARLAALNSAPWMDISAITRPSYLTPAQLRAMREQQAAQAAAAQAASNRGKRNGAASTTSTTRGSRGNTTRRAAQAVPTVGETGLNLYDWYRNGSDGISEPTGFTVGENGLIDRKTGYTQEYRDLVKKRTADDIRKWAAKHPNDPSLQSFLANNGPDALNKLTDEQWRTGALDGKYGFMHHVANDMLQNPQTPQEEPKTAAPAATRGTILLDEDGKLTPIDAATEDMIFEQEMPGEYGNVQIYKRKPKEAAADTTKPVTEKVDDTTGNGKFKPRPTWMRQMPIWMSGLAALRGELTPPDYTNADAILSAAYAAGRPVSVGTEYVGDYRRRDPFDERYLMNIINQNAAATRENLMNFSGGNRAVAMSGMMNNDLTRQMALAEAARQAYLANRADDVQVSDFNYRTNKGNADAQNTRNLALAQLNSGRQNAMLSGVAQGARLRQAIKDQRDAAISANWTAFAQNMGDWGKENGYYNMLGGLNDEGVLKYFFGDDWTTKFNNNSTV